MLGSAALHDRDGPRSSSRGSATGSWWGSRRTATPCGRAAPTSSCPLRELLVWLAGLEVRRYLFTEVGRVGALEGPDLDGIRAFAEVSAAPVVVAGGIRGVDDLRAVAALDGRIEGAVIGRALYEGLDLRAAIAAVA